MAAKDDKDPSAPLGEGTEKFLEDVKKGRTRSFLMICKGAKVQYLAAHKKPFKPAKAAAAKNAGFKGDAYIGTVSGKGAQFVFHLLKADSASAPVKDMAVKEFLGEHTKFQVYPTFEIVDVLPPIPFDEEDLKNPLIARFLKLEPAIVQVLDKNPAAIQELERRTSEIRELLQAEKLTDAEPKINDLIKRLKEFGQQQPASTSPEPQSPPPSTSSNQPPPSSTAPQSSANDDQRKELESALEQLVPRFDDAVRRMLGNPDQMRAVMGFVREKLEADDLVVAAKGLERLTQMVDDALAGKSGKATDVIAENIVADRKKFLASRWQDTIRQVHAEIDKLRDAIAINNPDEANPNELPSLIAADIDDFLSDFNDAMIGVGKSQDDDRKPTERVLEQIRLYREQIGVNAMIQHLNDANSDMGVTVDVESVLRAALDDIAAKLDA